MDVFGVREVGDNFEPPFAFHPPVKQGLILTKDYRFDNKRFWLSAHNCQVPTPTSQNLDLEQLIWVFGAD